MALPRAASPGDGVNIHRLSQFLLGGGLTCASIWISLSWLEIANQLRVTGIPENQPAWFRVGFRVFQLLPAVGLAVLLVLKHRGSKRAHPNAFAAGILVICLGGMLYLIWAMAQH